MTACCLRFAQDAAAKEIPEKWIPYINNLKNRFYETDEATIIAALHACDGYPADAAKKLARDGQVASSAHRLGSVGLQLCCTPFAPTLMKTL